MPENVSIDPSQELVSRMAREVDGLLQKHCVELNRCLEHWAGNLRAAVKPTQFAPNPSPTNFSKQLTAPAVCPVAGELGPQPVDELDAAEADVQTAREQCAGGEEQAIPKAQASQSGPDPAAQLEMVTCSFAATPSTTSSTRPRRRRREKLFSAPGTSEGLASETRLQRITTSRCYELFSGTLIFFNALFIGVQTQYLAHRAMEAMSAGIPLERREPTVFLVLQGVFATLFTIELVARWAADGLIGFFLADDQWWNLLDAGVVTIGWTDLFIGILFGESDVLGNFTVARVLRVVRIVRVIRVIRIMKFFRELRMMIYSILRSMKPLVWVILVLALTFYIFGIMFTVGTYTTLDRSEDWFSPETAALRSYFATVDRSCFSLFMAMSGGSGDWIRYFAALERLPYPYRVMFVLYICFTLFAVVNIVTGIFVDSAMESNSHDRIVTAHEELEAKKEYLEAMRDVFEEMDVNSSGIVSLHEFEAKLADERVVAYFNAMGLNINDAKKLFWLLGSDQSNSIDVDEFVLGCFALQGESRTLDTKLMERTVQAIHEQFFFFARTLQRVEKSVSELSRFSL